MPVYPMICNKCGATKDVVQKMTAVHNALCPCGFVMERNWQESNFNTQADSYHTPIHSDALAIHPDQVAEHKQHFPDIELDSQCRPVFDKFSKHEAYLKKTGFRKKRQRIRRRSRKATP